MNVRDDILRTMYDRSSLTHANITDSSVNQSADAATKGTLTASAPKIAGPGLLRARLTDITTSVHEGTEEMVREHFQVLRE